MVLQDMADFLSVYPHHYIAGITEYDNQPRYLDVRYKYGIGKLLDIDKNEKLHIRYTISEQTNDPGIGRHVAAYLAILFNTA